MNRFIYFFSLISIFYIKIGFSQNVDILLSQEYIELKPNVIELKNDNIRFIPHAIFCNENYIVVAQSHSSPCYYIYDYEGNLKTSNFHIGRGPQDLLGPDLRFFSSTKDGFRILDRGNTICDVEYKNNKLSIVKKEQLQIDLPVNYLIDLGNDRFCTTAGINMDKKLSDYEFCITNTSSRNDNKYFGQYPIEYNFRDDGDRIFKCMPIGVASSKYRRFAYFYRFIGGFKLYDYTTKLIKNVSINNTRGIAIKDNTADRTLYFRCATSNSQYIFTTYHNCRYKDLEQENTTIILQWDWDGNLIKQYRLNNYIDRIAVSESNVLVGINTLDDKPQMYLYKINM